MVSMKTREEIRLTAYQIETTADPEYVNLFHKLWWNGWCLVFKDREAAMRSSTRAEI